MVVINNPGLVSGKNEWTFAEVGGWEKLNEVEQKQGREAAKVIVMGLIFKQEHCRDRTEKRKEIHERVAKSDSEVSPDTRTDE